jgi:hypothetical protein
MPKAANDHSTPDALLESACNEIYRVWLRYLPEDAAREQAAQFARRAGR